MKFTVLAALFAAVAAEKCDPEQLWYEIYNDAQCEYYNKEESEKYWETPKDTYFMYEQGCHKYGNASFTIECDTTGLHQRIYKDTKCEELGGKGVANGGKWNYEWNTCEKVPGAEVYFVVRTTQVFEDQNGPALLF